MSSNDPKLDAVEAAETPPQQDDEEEDAAMLVEEGFQDNARAQRRKKYDRSFQELLVLVANNLARSWHWTNLLVILFPFAVWAYAAQWNVYVTIVLTLFALGPCMYRFRCRRRNKKRGGCEMYLVI
eukprot:g1494.t1